jgi:hypothetical protein
MFDVPSNNLEHIDSLEQSFGGVKTRRQGKKHPVDRWINDADWKRVKDFPIVFGIQPCSTGQLKQTEGIDHHSPETWNW